MTRFTSLALAAALWVGTPAPAALAESASAAPAPVAWLEIPSKDTARARRFYQAVFGWRFTPSPADGYDAWRFTTGTEGVAGVMTSQIYTVKAKGTIVYMRVTDVETALTRAIALGGTVERPRKLVPGLGSTVVLLDPDKNAIGLVGPAPRTR
jgi:predicted enzyme related to lactoylglutathione lyase